MVTSQLTYPDIDLPFVGEGAATRIAEGIFWLRMPIGEKIEAINVWALADGDGWAIVDTGLRSTETAAAWRKAFALTLEGRPIRRVIATHLHPDHSGMAGWLVRRQPARLWMTRLEYLTLRVLAADTGQEAPPAAINFYKSSGWDEDALDHYRARFGDFGKMLYPPPDSFQAMVHGQSLKIGAREWRVVVGKGHSPEHAMLHCSEAKLLISGDQVLPTISSNVSVQPLEPEADPLSDWLDSLKTIRHEVPDDVLVLPAHGRPFHGLHARISALLEGHEASLGRLHLLLESPQRAIDVFPALFRRQIDRAVLGLATGESLAHLACLRSRGLAVAESDDEGIRRWRVVRAIA